MAEEAGETEPLVEEPAAAEDPDAKEPEPAQEEAPAEDPEEEGAGEEKEDEKKVEHNVDLYQGGITNCLPPDVVFLLGWLASIIIVWVLAENYGFPVLEHFAEYVDDDTLKDKIEEEGSNITKALYIPLYCIGICSAACICWIIIMLLCGKALMWSFLLILIGGSGYGAFYFYVAGNATLAMPFGLLCMFICMYSCSVANNIAFASTTLQIATHVVLEYFSLIAMSLVMVALTAGYLILWAIGFLGLYYYLEASGESTINQLIVYFVMLVFFFWTAAVLQNIVIVTTVGVVSLWWTGASGFFAVPLSFCRATTWNLGAICFGSFLIAVITAIDYCVKLAIKQMKDSENQLVVYALYALDLIVQCLKCIMEYLTEYAFCFVGIYGYSFIHAGYEVLKLLGGDLSLVLQNDGLVATVILIGKLVVAGAGAYVSQYLVNNKDWANGIPDAEANFTSIGGLIGWSISGVIFGLVSAGNKAALILWKDKPENLKQTHPAFYEELDYIWTKCMGRHNAQKELDEKHAAASEGKK